MVALPDGKKLRICSAVSTEYRRVTDRRTDEQIDILQRRVVTTAEQLTVTEQYGDWYTGR